MKTLILFLKGLVIGMGKVIPGVSGSLLAISMGIYEEAIKKIENIWESKKESILFLGPLGIGILISVLLGSGILLHFLETYYVFTVTVFIGLIVGTVPQIVKKEKITTKDWISIAGIVLMFYILEKYLKLPTFTPDGSFISNSYIIILGFIDAATMVLPGISGTATYMMLGSYEYILNLFSNPFANMFATCLFGFGLIIGVFIMIKVVNYCFKKHKHLTWICVIGFLFSSILSLILKIIDLINQANLFSIILLFIISYSIINMFSSE